MAGVWTTAMPLDNVTVPATRTAESVILPVDASTAKVRLPEDNTENIPPPPLPSPMSKVTPPFAATSVMPEAESARRPPPLASI